jgi:hypothetical protein
VGINSRVLPTCTVLPDMDSKQAESLIQVEQLT